MVEVDLRAALERARAKLVGSIDDFISDWAAEYGFRVEREVTSRSKSDARIREKCELKGVMLEDVNLLGDHRHVVRDLVGIRIVLRTLADIDLCRTALEENFSISLEFDDKITTPSPTGYRALHANGEIQIELKGEEVVVPFEIQLKTLAQDAWGFYTHDSVYSRRGLREDPRFERLRGLQRMLSTQLHVVDETQVELEMLMNETVQSIEGTEDGDTIAATHRWLSEFDISKPAFTMEVVNRLHDLGLTPEQARHQVDLDSEDAIAESESFRLKTSRRPSPEELIRILLSRSDAEATVLDPE